MMVCYHDSKKYVLAALQMFLVDFGGQTYFSFGSDSELGFVPLVD